MALAPTETSMTVDEFFAMKDDGRKYDLIDGRLVEIVKPGLRHGALQMRIGVLLDAHIEHEGIDGVVIGEVGVRVDPEAHTVRAPDVCFLAGARGAGAAEHPGFADGAPDLAIEITSPSDTHTAVQDKALMWLAAGSRLVLVVDPEACAVTAYRAADDIRVHRGEETVDATDVIAGWELSLPVLFRR